MTYRQAFAGRCLALGAAPLVLMLLASCNAKTPESPSAAASPAPVPSADTGTPPASTAAACEQLMQPLTDALWGRRPQAVEDKLALPLTVVQQQYEPGDSDVAYVLGSAQTSTINAQADAAKLLATLAARVSAKDGDLVPRPRVSEDTSWDATFVDKAGAGDLHRCVITLAVGDTEHVLIAGFDSSDEQIRALYWN